MDRGSSGEGVGGPSDWFLASYECLVLDQSSRMTLPTFFSRLDPFQAFRRVNIFACDMPSVGASGILCFWQVVLWSADLTGFGFWEAHGTGAAAVIGSDKAETPRSSRRLFRHVLRARLLRDLTG